ncbi:MAG: hypothetical protein R3A45_12845 [Bdellovibrionota bacterium]
MAEDKVEIVVQINGKRRANIEVAPDISKEDAEALSMQQDNVRKHLRASKS